MPTRPVAVRLTQDEVDRLDAEAEMLDRTRQWVMRRLLSDAQDARLHADPVFLNAVDAEARRLGLSRNQVLNLLAQEMMTIGIRSLVARAASGGRRFG